MSLPPLICPFVLTADIDRAVMNVTTFPKVITRKPSTKIKIKSD